MRNKFTSLVVLLGCFQLSAQTANADLDINEVKARLNPAGDLFWDFVSAKFEVPKGHGVNSIFAGQHR
jgi:hypothetical protein